MNKLSVFALSVLVLSTLACGSSATLAAPIISSATPVPTTDSTTAPAIVTSAPTSTAPPLARLGETLELGGISLSAVQVADPAKSGVLYEAKGGTRLIAVEVILGNVSSADAISSNILNFTLIDAEGFAYDSELFGTDDQMALVDLAIGEKSKGWVPFEIPTSAVPASIKYRPHMFSDLMLEVGLTP